MDADPVLVDLYTPEDIADALTKMTQIEAQLQTRFQNLTVVQRNLHDKCEEMSVQLVRIKADMQDSTAMDRIKEKAQVLAKSNNMTTNELLSSIDTIGDDTMRAELIENYEKFSTYSVKFIVSVFADV